MGTHTRSPEDDPGHATTDLFKRLAAEAVKSGADGDRIAAALEQATQAAADVLAERLRADAPRMVREHRDFRRGFEKRLQQRWGLCALIVRMELAQLPNALADGLAGV